MKLEDSIYLRLVAGAILLFLSGCGAFTGPDDLKIADPARAVSDARQLIKEQRSNPERGDTFSGFHRPEALPESLRLPGLLYAHVEEDHVDLVLARNPDWNIGARIWSLDTKRIHKDQPTKYPEVFFYRYTNDAKESPENIR